METDVNSLTVRLCTLNDVNKLAEMNRQLVEDEKSDNRMSFEEFRKRMEEFLTSEYEAYFFIWQKKTVGYALVKFTAKPFYLRQFFIWREFRRKHLGKTAFNLLLEELNVNSIDLEVLSWNEAARKFWENCGFAERSIYLRLEK